MRHRRPRHAAPACALASVLALGACGEQPSGEPASTGASATTAQASGVTIPDDFPLSAGMGGPQDTIATSRTGTGLRDLELCRTTPLRGLGARDRMVADTSGGESADTRELLVLSGDEEATSLSEEITALATDCEVTRGVDGMEARTEVLASPFGPAPAATLLRTYTFDGAPGTGATVVHVVPVGPAVLLTSTYGQWTADRAEQAVDDTVEPLRDTVAALEAFGERPEATEDPTEDPTEEPTEQPTGEPAPAAIPADFPLLAGWPEDSSAEPGAGNGRQGPVRGADTVELRACGETWDESGHVDRLHAGWVDVEDHRIRQLTTYGDADAAAAAVEALVSQQRACPDEPAGEDGFATTREVRPVALGDDGWAILERDTFDGAPSAFGESSLVVRVGLAVLVVRHGGHAGYPSGDGHAQVEAMGSEAARSIARMCLFTKTGC
ncbi:hypothetical protein GCM10011376_16410 [Nocardioides flavus (ex Wang et al. 2016)]|uniref:PknH-like extracellular domain-containing protein n=1 Tax=Nocardioides flavus (ex Wang et al. 2016) TaxID=2058780 RepID=A0ABQ3HIA6_9ACTN|nr:hypothetical protein [Nocardioides flavus (ex Wang et al. 2016)]GHE17031.1 hypothetical protein GCM10011376_16410 [Nocardioides flavus (ex Wang et al. 2016)]